MLALLKRRWLLLSCAMAIASLAILDGGYETWSMGASENWRGCVVSRGNLFLFDGNYCSLLIPAFDSGLFAIDGQSGPSLASPTKLRLHAPVAGNVPMLAWAKLYIFIKIPIWFPLAAIVGWSVLRELHRRMKRGEQAEHEATA